MARSHEGLRTSNVPANPRNGWGLLHKVCGVFRRALWNKHTGLRKDRGLKVTDKSKGQIHVAV